MPLHIFQLVEHMHFIYTELIYTFSIYSPEDFFFHSIAHIIFQQTPTKNIAKQGRKRNTTRVDQQGHFKSFFVIHANT